MMSLGSFPPPGPDGGTASLRPASNPKGLAACFSGGKLLLCLFDHNLYFFPVFWTSYLAHYWKLFRYQKDNGERKDFSPMNRIQALVQILYPMTTNHAVVTLASSQMNVVVWNDTWETCFMFYFWWHFWTTLLKRNNHWHLSTHTKLAQQNILIHTGTKNIFKKHNNNLNWGENGFGFPWLGNGAENVCASEQTGFKRFGFVQVLPRNG